MSGKTKKTIHTPLTFGDIEALRRKGYNQSQIAAMRGVTRQAVSWTVRTYGGALSTRQIVDKAWPWKTTSLHGASKFCFQNLRNHGEYMATKGKGMSEEKLGRLRSFYRKLQEQNVVIEFDPTIPPIPDVSPHGGFRLVPRLESDEDLLIRVNEYTNLTDEGAMIWCWPPSFP